MITSFSFSKPCPSVQVSSPLLHQTYLDYARIFHKLLEDLVYSKKFENNNPLLNMLTPSLQKKLELNIEKLLANNEFLDLISGFYILKTEANIGMLHAEKAKTGRIDLLVVGPHNVIIIDYKSDRDTKNIPLGYIDQLNFYRHIIGKIYPDRRISCKILWLETATFVDV